MIKAEKKVLDWANSNLDIIFIVLITLCACLVRFLLKDTSSGDLRHFLIPWYERFTEGGLGSLSEGVGNYGMPYQTIIAFMTYLPIPAIYAYKLVSIIFDFVLAFSAMLLVREVREEKILGNYAYALIIISPIIVFNSSVWGQCDSIFTSFCFITLYYCLKEKYVPAFIAYGAACAFKLQAVFFLPFLAMLYFVKKKFSIANFLLIPGTMIVLSLGGLLQGRSVLDILRIYYRQAGEYKGLLSMNYPGIWAFMTSKFKSGIIQLQVPLAILAICILGILIYSWIRRNARFSGENLIYMAFLLSYLSVLIMPSMHERYGYIYEALAIVIVILDRKTIFGCVSLNMISLVTYSYYFSKFKYDAMVLSFVNVATFMAYLWYLDKKIMNNSADTEELLPGS